MGRMYIFFGGVSVQNCCFPFLFRYYMIGISQSFRQLGRPPPHHLLHHSHFPPNENSYHPPWSRLHYIHSPLNPLNHIIWSSPPSHLNCRQQSSSGRFMLMQRLQHNWWVNWLEQRLHSIWAEICGDLTQKCAGGGRFLADSSCMCWGGAFFGGFILHCIDLNHYCPLWPESCHYLFRRSCIWRWIGGDILDATCISLIVQRRRGSCLVVWTFCLGGGDGTVTAGSLFAAADKLLLESSCFLPHPLLCWHRITGGVLPGWHVIVGDNQSGTNRQVWYFMGVRSHQVWYFMGVSLIMDHPWVVVKGAQVWYLASFRNRTLSR
jgi:hypothetical protein